MGDFNAPMNDSAKPFTKAPVKILEWEETGETRTLNDKQEPTHIPFQKGHQRNFIDIVMITPGLERKLKSYKLNIAREWTPARAEATWGEYFHFYRKLFPDGHFLLLNSSLKTTRKFSTICQY